MADLEQKRRKLRLSEPHTKNQALLYDFDNTNPLLHREQRIHIDTKSPPSAHNLYQHFGEASWRITKDLPQFSPVGQRQEELPRLRRRAGTDPLPDSVYETFHRRMKKDEKSRVVTDRGRMYFEMDNLKSYLELLRQHDWVKHLPQITVVKNRGNVDELLWKRNATIAEIEKTLAKFADWERRCSQVAADVKRFDKRNSTAHLRKKLDDSDDSDDSTESILSIPLEVLAEQRRRRRIAKHGRAGSIILRNGFVIRYDPYKNPRVAIVPERGSTA